MVRVVDIGPLDGPVALFGGAYSNVQATQAFFDAVADIPRSNRIFTGDLVAYCANPARTAELVLDRSGLCIAGNCDRQIADGADDCGCGFEEGSACDLASKGWYPFAAVQMQGLRTRLEALPGIGLFQHAGRRYAVIHGGVADIARFLWPSDPEACFAEEVDRLTAHVGPINGVISGHCGIAFERMIGPVQWINAGVIGMPPHDGRPHTRYALLTGDGVRFHDLHYDAASASDAMTAAGLTQGYGAALLSGVWPSEDVLPQALRLEPL